MPKDKKTTSYPISGIKYLIDQNKINFEPSYQRGYVWKKTQKELLIDSLFLGYDLPKIYFHEHREGNKIYDVVDGQQRLRTIYDFLMNRLKLPADSDPINGFEIANKYFNELSLDLQMDFQAINLDVVVLNSEYTTYDIEDMFLRYQNGEPLNAAEKRKAVPGNFKNIVQELAEHKIFEKCNFNNSRNGYEDAVAKILHVRIFGNFTSITPDAIKRTYISNKGITRSDPHVKDVSRILTLMVKSFDLSNNPSPRLKKYAVLTLAEVFYNLSETYSIVDFKGAIANSYLNFEQLRIENEELDESMQDSIFSGFTDAARGDSPAQQEYRYKTLLEFIIKENPEITTKDPNRAFTDQQRLAIYNKNGGVCQNPTCGKSVAFEEFHADHIVPHSRSGKTTVSNGQVLCLQCNLSKSNKGS
jgi:hypothetical protein